MFRYKFLNEISLKNNAYITTGHHTDDYLETVFINLIRGGGYSTLNTLPIYKNGIFRPMMVFTEEERHLLTSNSNWKFFEDESNQSEDYLRNRIRLNVLPILKKEGLNSTKVYENFHNEEDLYLENQSPENSKKTPSFLKINRISLETIPLGILKKMLDVYTSILKVHPLSKKIILEVKKELEKNTNFQVQNKEIILWKNPTSDLFLIPSNSPVLQKPKLEIKNKISLVHWNNQVKEIPSALSLGLIESGLKILQNGKHKEISELFRFYQIPVPIRSCIPILFQGNKAKSILFPLFDSKIPIITTD